MAQRPEPAMPHAMPPPGSLAEKIADCRQSLDAIKALQNPKIRFALADTYLRGFWRGVVAGAAAIGLLWWAW